MQDDLRSFLGQLEQHGLLARVTKEVDPRFELTGVAQKAEKLGRALLFENVRGYGVPVACNVFSTRRMLGLVFDSAPEDAVRVFAQRMETRIPPTVVPEGPVKEVVRIGEDASMDEWPLVTHCSKDAGPYITAGTIVARDPETGIRNVSVNRMMYKGAHSLACRMMPPQHLGQIQAKAEAMKEPLEIAVVIGNHPIETLVASTSVNFGDDEYGIAGALRQRPLEVVKCETVDLEVPATAEIVLEGEVLPGVREPEGPFGDFMQYYVPIMDNHVFRLKAITHRKDPIWQSIQAGSQEDIQLQALSREAQVLRAVLATGAKVKAVSLMPMNLNCIISIEKQFEGEPKNVMAAAFGVYRWLKYCVVVDHDVDAFDLDDVWWAMATRSNAGKGLMPVSEAMGFPRDLFHIHQSKLGIDATAPLNQWEEFERKRVPGVENINLNDYLD